MLAEGKEIFITGGVPRMARLRAEHYEWVSDPGRFISEVKGSGAKADLLTFLQPLTDPVPKHRYYWEYETIAVIPLSTYDNWWSHQINDKTRNMIRKAERSGVELRLVEFDDALIRGIKEIYDEVPLRQGRPFRHYGKDIDTLRRDHISFLDHSQFLGAFCQGELIGFIKLVHDGAVSHIMQILSKVAHRAKAPTNALIARAVEICAERHAAYLHYSEWDRRGIGDFKRHHAFQPFDLPRYYVPLTIRGRLILRLKLHRGISARLPETVQDRLKELRNQFNSIRFKT